jgi:hypothetical protein
VKPSFGIGQVTVTCGLRYLTNWVITVINTD